MTMSSVLIDQVKRRAADEAERHAYPAGFPVLPPVPAGPLRRSRVRGARERGGLRTQLADGRARRRAARARVVPPGGPAGQADRARPRRRRAGPRVLQHVQAPRRGARRRGGGHTSDGGSPARTTTGCTRSRVSWSATPSANNFSDLDRDCLALDRDPVRDVGPLDLRQPGPGRHRAHRVPRRGGRRPQRAGRARRARSTSSATATATSRSTGRSRSTPTSRRTTSTTSTRTRAALGLRPGGHRHPAARRRPLADARSASTTASSLTLAAPAALRRRRRPARARGPSRTTCSRTSASCSANPGFLFFITNWPTGPGTSTYHVHWCASVGAGRPRARPVPRAVRDVQRGRPVRGPDRPPRASSRRSTPARSTGSSWATRSVGSTTCTRRSTGSIGAERIPESLRVRQVLGDHVEADRDRMHPFVALMRRYCIDYTNSHDQSLYDELMEPDYVVHINGMDLGRSTTYARSVEKLFAMAPGLGLVVHDFVLNGDRLCMYFSEHAAMPGPSGPGAGVLARHRPLQVERDAAHRELRRAGLRRDAGAARVAANRTRSPRRTSTRGRPPKPSPPMATRRPSSERGSTAAT